MDNKHLESVVKDVIVKMIKDGEITLYPNIVEDRYGRESVAIEVVQWDGIDGEIIKIYG